MARYRRSVQKPSKYWNTAVAAYSGAKKAYGLYTKAKTVKSWVGAYGKKHDYTEKSDKRSKVVNNSFQKDAAVLYQRHPAPKKVRQRAKRKQRAFNALMSRNNPQTILLQDYAQVNSSIANAQAYCILSVASVADLRALFNKVRSLSFTQNGPGRDPGDPINTKVVGPIASHQNFLLKNHYLDYSCTNTGTSSIVMECYEMVPRRNITLDEYQNTATGGSGGAIGNELLSVPNYMTALFNGWEVNTSNTAITDPSVPINMSLYGATPFHAVGITKKFVINKVERHILGSGQTWTRQVRTNVNKIINGEQLQRFEFLRGVSKVLMCRFYGLPSGSGGGATPSTLSCLVVEKYKAKYMNSGLSDTSIYTTNV